MLAFLGYALLAVVVFFALIAIVEHFSASLANKVLVLVPLCLLALPFSALGLLGALRHSRHAGLPADRPVHPGQRGNSTPAVTPSHSHCSLRTVRCFQRHILPIHHMSEQCLAVWMQDFVSCSPALYRAIDHVSRRVLQIRYPTRSSRRRSTRRRCAADPHVATATCSFAASCTSFGSLAVTSVTCPPFGGVDTPSRSSGFCVAC